MPASAVDVGLRHLKLDDMAPALEEQRNLPACDDLAALTGGASSQGLRKLKTMACAEWSMGRPSKRCRVSRSSSPETMRLASSARAHSSTWPTWESRETGKASGHRMTAMARFLRCKTDFSSASSGRLVKILRARN